MNRWIKSITLPLILILSACYEQDGTPTNVWRESGAWTGSGDYSAGSSYGGMAIGLAGQDMVFFDQSGLRGRTQDVLAGEFSGPYELTSIAQTFSVGHHEQSFLHGNLVGRTDNLDLFFTVQSQWWHTAPVRISASDDIVIRDGSRRFTITQICDMATPDVSNGWVLPDHPQSHLFLSVRACEGSSCVGGVVEAAFVDSFSRWSIKYTGMTQHAHIHRTGSHRFSNECMPIAATRRSSQDASAEDREYLYLLDPSMDQIHSFDTHNFTRGAVDQVRYSGAHRPMDITAEAVRLGDLHHSFVQTLWRNGSRRYITHHYASNGQLSDEEFLLENVNSDITHIQSLGSGFRNNVDERGHLVTLGRYGTLRHYRK